MAPLHSSLGNKSETPSQKKKILISLTGHVGIAGIDNYLLVHPHSVFSLPSANTLAGRDSLFGRVTQRFILKGSGLLVDLPGLGVIVSH